MKTDQCQQFGSWLTCRIDVCGFRIRFMKALFETIISCTR